jgi:hypothetical protein
MDCSLAHSSAPGCTYGCSLLSWNKRECCPILGSPKLRNILEPCPPESMLSSCATRLGDPRQVLVETTRVPFAVWQGVAGGI